MQEAIQKSEQAPRRSGADFLKDLARYYMDFLETDFHKRPVPKRSIKLRDGKSNLIGINLRKYDAFRKAMSPLFQNEIKLANTLTIQRGQYKSKIKVSLRNFIHETIDDLEQKAIEDIIVNAFNDLKKLRKEHHDDWDAFYEETLDAVRSHSNRITVQPLLEVLEKPLTAEKSLGLDTIYMLEEELQDLICQDLESNIDKPLIAFFNKSEIEDLTTCLYDFLNKSIIADKLKSYFENFSTSDLFLEFHELFENNRLHDKQDLYLYFCKISYNSKDYPLFYFPLNVSKQPDSFELSFDPRIFINKKALEYVVQEYNSAAKKVGNLNSLKDRILYLQEGENISDNLKTLVSDIVSHFSLSEGLDLTDEKVKTIKSLLVNLSNDIYLCSFDRSDEALINDYEQIAGLIEDGDDLLADAYADIVESFIKEEPKSFSREIDNDWGEKSTSQRLVYDAPIPLNEEQKKILSALKKEGCKYVTVQGPPGTGKSHTITGIVFDTLMNGSSVLVLSDKKEALDVVEDKITETINNVRVDDNFQNPILRLDKINYSKIFSPKVLERIKEHYKATETRSSAIKDQIDKTKTYLGESIDKYVTAYSEIDLDRIRELNKIERDLFEDQDTNDFEINDRFHETLHNIHELFEFFTENVNTDEYGYVLKLLSQDSQSLLSDKASNAVERIKVARQLNEEGVGADLSVFTKVDENAQTYLQAALELYRSLTSNFIKKFLNRSAINKMNFEINSKFELTRPINITEDFMILERAVRAIAKIKSSLNEEVSNFGDVCSIVTHKHCPSDVFESKLDLLENISDYCDEDVTEFLAQIGVNFDVDTFKSVRSLEDCEVIAEKLCDYADIKNDLTSKFGNIPELDYVSACRQLEELQTTRMTNIIDRRVIDFVEDNRNTAKTLKEIIRKKQKFPRDKFEKTQEAFPCIIAGIRDYAEYIPLEKELFDLVIIDEASQVSIAQAFPALLRAKKILVLGDTKQFSNVKTSNASNLINQKYMSNIRESFFKNFSNDSTELQKVEQFNIRTSILDFFDFISNYNIMLKKHFRGYKELISFSSKYFYDGGLQAIKIRAKPIDDVLKFTVLEHDGKHELESHANTNPFEAEFIIAELEEHIKNKNHESVGIITPFTNQQKFLSSEVGKSDFADEIYENLKLKIMTFDTCQGEERDIIYYSMVASDASDQTNYIFPRDLKDDEDSEKNLRKQRLNVGFSRSKECMHFVLSKPLDKFEGSIGKALKHYQKISQLACQEPTQDDVDPSSPMEVKVLEWIKNAAFYQKNMDRIQLHAQFPIGEYLKQLDAAYTHPNYRCDFLFQYSDGDKSTNIIIEYDGFKEHFKDLESVNVFNYEDYYKDADVEREKVLESYGYKFVRINRFNLGSDPVHTLSERLAELVKKKTSLN